ncbi:hypothetical protein SAMN05216553_1379 [Lentzea fradiae]|uniref:Uncharacterized protein n=1 Tax=Lentzea fradiae TaxID=200378 RepID=A0A1G8DW89_9PSEU|nr:hypothetical protein [Lentzea fradiae]SDH61952.1 hypothetical protein SAMN05216553_1379 [Lentzea fradiae]
MGAEARFIADVVQTGTVLGLDANMGPDLATEIMGGPGEEHRYGRTVCRSYGLVELVWRERRRGLGRVGEHLAVQAHLLEHDVLDDAVAAAYGQFSGLLMFEELRDELARRHVGLVEVGDRQYWQPEAQTTVHVGADSGCGAAVQKVFTAFGQDLAGSFRGDPKAVWQRVKAVAAMSENGRAGWAETKAPEDFRLCAKLTAHRTASHDVVRDRQAFVELAFWMWDHGRDKGVYSSAEVAFARAEFVARLDELYPELELPDFDELVDACLDHVSEDLSRKDKNLVDVANLLRHNLTDTPRLDAVYRKRVSRR